jgi:hypothetical protein
MPDQPILMRHWMILRTLSARRRGATLRQLADEMGVSSKTIHRDLLVLSQLGFPLIGDVGFRGQKHWRLDQTKGLLQLQFTIEEAAALYLGRQFLEPLAGTYFFEGAQRAFEKIRTTLGEAALRHLEKLAAAFYHTTHGWTDYSEQAQRIDDLVRAIEDRRLTVITYQSLQATEPVSHYDVHPYCLVAQARAVPHRLVGRPPGDPHVQGQPDQRGRGAAAPVPAAGELRPASVSGRLVRHLPERWSAEDGARAVFPGCGSRRGRAAVPPQSGPAKPAGRGRHRAV